VVIKPPNLNGDTFIVRATGDGYTNALELTFELETVEVLPPPVTVTAVGVCDELLGPLATVIAAACTCAVAVKSVTATAVGVKYAVSVGVATTKLALDCVEYWLLDSPAV
jgi:hypothetical protein